MTDIKSDREKFIAFWAPTCGEEEALRSWKIKQAQVRTTSAMVMGDIAPYISQIDGSVIESRSKHRAHLKQHGCIEIGNEVKHIQPKAYAPPPGLKESIIENFHRNNL